MATITKQQSIQNFNSKISQDYATLYTIKQRPIQEYGEDDYLAIEKIKNNLSETYNFTELLKHLTPEVAASLDYIRNTLNDMTILFSYTPSDGTSKNSKQNQPSEKRYSYRRGNTVIGLHPYTEGGKALGLTKRTLGLIDDVTNYDGQPTMEITKQSAQSNVGESLHKSTDVGGGYSVSFNFKLNRFPSKTYQDNSQGWYMKQYTTRRTDLITFDYETNTKNGRNTIEFGAMAPFDSSYSEKNEEKVKGGGGHIIKKEWNGELDEKGFPTILNIGGGVVAVPEESIGGKFKFQRPKQNTELVKYNNKYSKKWGPFSIAACFTINKNRKISLFTDYKFELGVWYTVTLDILPYKDATIYEAFEASLMVNGVKEEVLLFNGKVWGKEAKNFKNAEQIPTKPNFESASYGSRNFKGDAKLENVGQTFNDTVKQVVNRDEIIKNLHNMSVLTHNEYQGKGNFTTNFSTLNSVYTSPSYINLKNNGKHSDVDTYDKIYKNYTYKTNNGVDFGTITIYSQNSDKINKNSDKARKLGAE